MIKKVSIWQAECDTCGNVIWASPDLELLVMFTRDNKVFIDGKAGLMCDNCKRKIERDIELNEKPPIEV